MDRKARLNRADAYQVAVGAEQAARMVAAYAAGRPGPRRLGSEQGVVPGWDDLVIEREDGVLEHHQVKSQTTDFSDLPIRGTDPRSSLEKDLAALANWTPSDKGPSRQFVLDLRTQGVQIRKDLRVDLLVDLAEECARESADADLFAGREKTSPLNERLGRWLRTRCDFKDWTHIIGRLKLMRVRHCEAPTNIEDRAKVVLEPLFSPAATAYAELRHFLLDEGGPTQATTPAILYEHLRPRVRSGASEWAAWIRSDGDWAALGTVARDVPAHAVVDRVWAPAGRGARVAIHSPAPESDDQTLMPRAVARLALHSTGPITVHLDDPNRWRDQATTWVGGTLGMSDGARPGAHWCAAEPR